MDIYPAIGRFYAGLTLSLLLCLHLLSAPSITGVHSLEPYGSTFSLCSCSGYCRIYLGRYVMLCRGGHLRTEMDSTAVRRSGYVVPALSAIFLHLFAV
ncbi:hypothetical protein B0H17DRAFT_1085668, partial [Mycena rosella]